MAHATCSFIPICWDLLVNKTSCSGLLRAVGIQLAPQIGVGWKTRGCKRKEILQAQTTSVQKGILTSSYRVLVLYRSCSDSELQRHIASAELFLESHISHFYLFTSIEATIPSST